MKKIREHPARSLGFLSRYHDGDLPPEERDEFVRHAAECPECGEAASEYEAVLAMYRESSAEAPDPSLAARISRRIDAEIRHRAPVRFLSLEIDLLWASVVAVGLVGVLAVYGVFGRRAARAPSVFVAENSREGAPRSPARENVPPTAPSREPASPAPQGSARERETKTTTRSGGGGADRPAGNSSPSPVAGEESEDRSDAGVAAGFRAESAPASPPLADSAPAREIGEEPPAALRDEPVPLGPGITPPVLLRRGEWKVPDSLRAELRAAGTIRAAVEITREGEVRRVRVLRSVSPRLAAAVEAALQERSYRPALRDGKPVAVSMTVTIGPGSS